MAVNKNFVVKNGLEVSTDLILADAARNKVGIGSTTPRTELDVRGGIAATDISISGVGTIVTLQSSSASITNLVLGVGTVGAVQATHITASGVTTATTLNVTGTGTIAVGVVTHLRGTNLNYSGIATANSISIGATQVISNERQLQNIASLDATTTATIEAAISNAPNTFTDLRVTGFSTLNAVSAVNANVTGITTLGITTVTQLASAGIVTALSFRPTSGYYQSPNGTNAFYVFDGTGNVAFQGTIGASQLNSASGNKVIGLSANDAAFERNVTITGVTTAGRVVFRSGIVTASSGIVTYYGDGRYLQNVISGVGIGSTGGVVGYGVTFINFYGPGVSTAYYSSTTGIATVYFQGGGGGGGAIGIGSTFPGTPLSLDPAPSNGDLFFHINYGRTFIYYDEVDLGIGSTAVWIDSSPFNIGVLNPVSIALSTGTFSSPSLYFSGDTDTGLFQPTPNQQTFVAAGASVLNINPGGINVTGVVTATSIRSDGINVTGVVTATSFRGDGSNLTNLPAGLGTALSSDQTSPLNKIYYTDQVLSIGSTVTVDPPSTAKVAYTQYAEIQVDGDADLIIADGDEFIPNILGIGTTGTVGTIGGGGRVRADNFSNRSGTGAPTFNAGLNVSGIVTATGYIAAGAIFSGDVSAATFTGSGANLTNLNIPASFDWRDASLF
jgi:hypothetical protein